jgi:transcription antitermination factor NusG
MQARRNGTSEANCDSNWYALYTRHQHEKSAAAILHKKGFEVFLPLYTVSHNWQDRVKRVSLPLFPCYIFLRGCLSRWLHIMTTPGVCGIVGFKDPATIPTLEIERVRQMVESTLRVEPHPFLTCGAWVRVRSGSLAGLEGMLVQKKGRSRLVLSIEMLGKSVATEVDSSTVERISPRGGESALRRSTPVEAWA